jgi:hypothetical protein
LFVGGSGLDRLAVEDLVGHGLLYPGGRRLFRTGARIVAILQGGRREACGRNAIGVAFIQIKDL